MKMNAYLNFGGNCAEAFRYYEKHLGGKIENMMPFNQAPPDVKVDPNWKDKVMHARMSLGETTLMGADTPNYQPMRSFYLSLEVDSDDEAEHLYKALADGGEIQMPMQETFFATRFGQCRDKFGTSWMVLSARPMPAQA
jgi:PhnB protein